MHVIPNHEKNIKKIKIIFTRWNGDDDWRIKGFPPYSLALQTLELDEYSLPITVTAGRACRDMSRPDRLLAGTFTVRTDVASVAQL